MFLGLTFIQSIVVIIIAWDISLSVINSLKGTNYDAGASIIVVVIYMVGKALMTLSGH